MTRRLRRAADPLPASSSRLSRVRAGARLYASTSRRPTSCEWPQAPLSWSPRNPPRRGKDWGHVQNNSAVLPRRPLHPAPAFRHCAGRRRLAQPLHRRGAVSRLGTPGSTSPAPAAAANQTHPLFALPCAAAPNAKAAEGSTRSPPPRSRRSPVLLQARLDVSLETLLSVRAISDGRSSADRLSPDNRAVDDDPQEAAPPFQAAMPRD